MSGTATYIYCIVHAAAAPKASRVPPGLPDATPPSIVSVARSLWLVGAEVPLDIYGAEPLESALRKMDWVGQIAVAHEAVVEHLAHQPRVTVIPMKLFTMFSSTERAVEDMRSHQKDLRAIAKRIAGCEEWGVRMSAARRPRAAEPVVLRGASGAAFLAAKKQARDSVRESALALAAVAEDTFSCLSSASRDVRRRDDVPEGATPPLLDAAFLIPTTERASFKAAVRQLAREAKVKGAELTVTGPWPAYNFIQSGRRS
jgi:hypothetical protein